MYLTYMSKCTLPGATHSIDEPRAPGLPPWKTLEHYGEPKVHKPMQSQYIPHEHTHTHTKIFGPTGATESTCIQDLYKISRL